jgi:hypothetical protein
LPLEAFHEKRCGALAVGRYVLHGLLTSILEENQLWPNINPIETQSEAIPWWTPCDCL